MVNLREDTRESIAKLTLMDDIFMNKVFENDTERTALLLRIILNNDGRLQVQIEQDLSSNYISGIHLIKKSVEQFIRSVVA